MSACPSSPIDLLVARVGATSDRVSDPDPSREEADVQAPIDLVAALATVPDPRARRGIRHRLVTALALAVCAVLAGARSYVTVAEWAHDLPLGVRIRLGLKTNEITAFAPLPDRVDITDAIITADALHRQDEHARYLHRRGAHYVFIVKGNRPRPHQQLAGIRTDQLAEAIREQHRRHITPRRPTPQSCPATAHVTARSTTPRPWQRCGDGTRVRWTPRPARGRGKR